MKKTLIKINRLVFGKFLKFTRAEVRAVEKLIRDKRVYEYREL